MILSATRVSPVVTNFPMWRYDPSGWSLSGRDLASPAPDGSIAYYEDTLSPIPARLEDGPGFHDETARAVCQHLKAEIVARGALEIVDGPFLYVPEDDGCVPPGWQVLRAVAWVDEYDLVVEVSADAVSDAGLAGCQLIQNGAYLDHG